MVRCSLLMGLLLHEVTSHEWECLCFLQQWWHSPGGGVQPPAPPAGGAGCHGAAAVGEERGDRLQTAGHPVHHSRWASHREPSPEAKLTGTGVRVVRKPLQNQMFNCYDPTWWGHDKGGKPYREFNTQRQDKCSIKVSSVFWVDVRKVWWKCRMAQRKPMKEYLERERERALKLEALLNLEEHWPQVLPITPTTLCSGHQAPERHANKQYWQTAGAVTNVERLNISMQK